MSTAPVKSQPLHNFTLPQLKWGHKSHQTSSSNHRFRRRDSPSPELHHCEGGETEENNSATTTTNMTTDKLQTCPRTARNHHQRFSFLPCSSKQEKPQEEHKYVVVSHRDHSTDKETSSKLLSRKQVNCESETVSCGHLDRVERSTENNERRPSRLRGGNVEGTGPVKHKPRPDPGPTKLWISLSREEIEEDVYALTGSRPSRRPKKRPKTVQKLVDNIFPGMYMVGATVDLYRLHDALK